MLKIIKIKFIISVVIAAILLSAVNCYLFANKISYNQNIVALALTNGLSNFKPQINFKTYNEPVLKGLELDQSNLFNINFYFDTMQQNEIKDKDIGRLLRYFLGFLSLPEDKLWVNLSSYESDRIIPDALKDLDIGRDFLVQDYILKNFTTSLICSDVKQIKRFWQKINKITKEYERHYKIPINTFSKIWITADTAQIYENRQAKNIVAFIKEAKLKVMLEEDYTALGADLGPWGHVTASTELGTCPQIKTKTTRKGINQKIKELFKQEILPLIEQEVNSGANFVPLRQMYYSLILASYFKDKLKGNKFYKQYLNTSKISALAKNNNDVVSAVYSAYLNNLYKGSSREKCDFYNNRKIIRRYYAGGVRTKVDKVIKVERIKDLTTLWAKIKEIIVGKIKKVIILVKGKNKLSDLELVKIPKLEEVRQTAKEEKLASESKPVVTILQDSLQKNKLKFRNEKYKKLVSNLLDIVKDKNLYISYFHAFKGDLFGPIKDSNVLTIHEALRDDPAAVFKALEDYLLTDKNFAIRLEADNVLTVTYQKDLNIIELGRVNLSKDTLAMIKVNGWQNWQNNPGNLFALLQAQILGQADIDLNKKIKEFIKIMKYLKFNNNLITDVYQTPFTNLYDETKQLFDKIAQAAGVSGASLYFLDTDDIDAFAYAPYKIVAISRGVFKSLMTKGLTHDAIGFILAHELRHIVQYQNKQDKAKSKEEKFAQEMEADRWAIEIINSLGLNVKESEKLFNLLEQLDKTDNVNKGIYGILEKTIEIIDEHLPHASRIQFLKGVIEAANWRNTDRNTYFSSAALSEVIKDSAMGNILNKIGGITSFEQLKKIIEEASFDPTYMLTIAYYGILEIFNNLVFNDESFKNPDNYKYVDRSLVVAALLTCLFDEDILSIIILKLDSRKKAQIEEVLNRNFLQNKFLFKLKDDWSNFLKFMENKCGEDKTNLIVGYPAFLGAEVLINYCTDFFSDKNSQLHDDIKAVFVDNFTAMLKDRGDLADFSWLKDLIVIQSPYFNKKVFKKIDANRFTPTVSTRELDDFKMAYLGVAFEELAKAKKIGQTTWQDWQNVIVNFYQNNRYHMSNILTNNSTAFDFTLIGDKLIDDPNLTREEKRRFILDNPFLIYGSYDKVKSFKSISKKIIQFLYDYYEASTYNDKQIEVLFINIYKNSYKGKSAVADVFAIPALGLLVESDDSRLLEVFNFDSSTLFNMFGVWMNNKSNQEMIDCLGKLIDFFYRNKQETKIKDIIGNDLLKNLYQLIQTIDFNDKRIIAEIKETLIQSRAMEEKYRRSNIILSDEIKTVIYYYSRGGILSRDELENIFNKLSYYEQILLVKYLNSQQLKALHEAKYHFNHNDRERNFNFMDVNIDTLLKGGKDYLIKEENVNTMRSWSEYTLFTGLNVFLTELNCSPQEIGAKLYDLEEVFRIELFTRVKTHSELKELRIEPLFNRLLDFYQDKRAEKNISQTYEPLFEKIFTLPLYLDRTNKFKDNREFFTKLFDFILKSKVAYREILAKIKDYIPEGYFRNFMLLALLFRECANKYQDGRNIFDMQVFKGIVNTDEAIANKLEDITGLLTPDMREYALNFWLLGYLQIKMHGGKKTGIGAEDAFKNIEIKRNTFIGRFKDSVVGCLTTLTSYFFDWLITKLLYRYWQSRFLRRAQAITQKRGIDIGIVNAGFMDLLKSIVDNYYREQIVGLIYSKDKLLWLRKLICNYFSKRRIAQGVEKIPIEYFDFNHTQKLGQLDAVLPRLLEDKIETTIRSVDNSMESKVIYLCYLFVDAQPSRDKYLEEIYSLELARVENNQQEAVAFANYIVQEGAERFFNQFLKERYLFKALELERKFSGPLSLEDEAALIMKYFPNPSPFRDDLLKTVLARVKTFSEYDNVERLFYREKKHILSSESHMKSTYFEAKLKLLFEHLSAKDKKDFVLWLLGIKDMPIFMQEYEEFLGVSLQTLKAIYSTNKSDIYKFAGESTRSLFVEEMFLGDKGILSDEAIFKSFMQEISEFILSKITGKKGVSKAVLRKIFKAIVNFSNNRRRLEIVKALALNFSDLLEGKEASQSDYEIIPKFMESLGLIGIKIGQTIAFSQDMNIPEELRVALSKLSSSARPLTKKVVFDTLRNLGLENEIEELDQPLGNASVRVVFTAKMKGNGQIALKLKRPEVSQYLDEDLDFFAKVCNNLREEGIGIPLGFEDRVSLGIRDDVDFIREIEYVKKVEVDLASINQENLGKPNYTISGQPIEFLVPEIFFESNDKIIFTKKIEGIDLDHPERLVENKIVTQEELKQLKRAIFDFLMTQLFAKGLYLADPHGGNFRIAREDGKIKVYLIDPGSLTEIKGSKEIYKNIIKSLVFVQRGLDAEAEFLWIALFFKRMGYLMQEFDSDEILATIFSKIKPDNLPWEHVTLAKQELRKEVVKSYILQKKLKVKKINNFFSKRRKRGQLDEKVENKPKDITDDKYTDNISVKAEKNSFLLLRSYRHDSPVNKGGIDLKLGANTISQNMLSVNEANELSKDSLSFFIVKEEPAKSSKLF